MSRAWSVLPPPGPLSWLHPELAGLDRAVRARAAARSPVRCVDLGAARWSTAALASAEELELAGGPLGRALREHLGAALGSGTRLTLSEAPGEVAGVLATLTAGTSWWLTPLGAADAGAELAAREALPLTPASAERVRAARRTDAAWVLPIADARDVDEALRALARDPAPFRAAGLVPFFAERAPATSGARPATRRASAWFGILPGDECPTALRLGLRELVRLLHPERTLAQRAHENHALAASDLYAQALAGRFLAPPPEARRARARIVALEGIDGSGKSSHVAGLRAFLEQRGVPCKAYKIYRHGVFHATVTDLTRRCAGEHELHLWRLQRLAKLFDSLKALEGALRADLERPGVLLFDRYVFTHLAAEAGRLHHDPYARELLASFPAPDLFWLLDLPAERALERIGQRGERTVDENRYMLGRYRDVLLDLADRRGARVLSAEAPFEANQAVLRADVVRLLEAEEVRA